MIATAAYVRPSLSFQMSHAFQICTFTSGVNLTTRILIKINVNHYAQTINTYLKLINKNMTVHIKLLFSLFSFLVAREILLYVFSDVGSF